MLPTEREIDLIRQIRRLTERVNRIEPRELVDNLTEKTWSFASPSGATGITYFGGFYFFGATDSSFFAPVLFGTANSAYGAHFFIVLGVPTVDVLTIRVTGTSITDEAVRTAGDTQDIVIPNGTPVNSYFETSKKWIGQISIVAVTGTVKLANYGFTKYWDNNNMDFTIAGVDVTWLGGANDAGADLQLIHHKATGWTYNAGSTPTPPVAIASMATDYVTENDVRNNEPGAWKRTDLSVIVDGKDSEGTIIAIVTSANKAFEQGNFLITIQGV